MRIVGGRLRGLTLATPNVDAAAFGLRPTLERVRESVFDVLCHAWAGDRVKGARVLDLFAGTGAMGLEALSRGAEFVVFVEDDVSARVLIRTNIERARAMGQTKLLRRDATALGANRLPPFTLVFLDPPWGRGLGGRALAAALAGGWLAPSATIVWEEAPPEPVPPGFVLEDRRSWGSSTVTFLRAPEGNAP